MAGSPEVINAVVVVHGSNRNAAGYFKSMLRAAHAAGHASDTLVIAPWFKTRKDKPAEREAVWSYGGWKRGAGAIRPAGLSTFTVLDQLLARLGDRSTFPNLRRVTLAGHSAGGQFTQRYAVFGMAPNTITALTVNYVVANPSSFLYFSEVRPSADGQFVVPPIGCCSGFDSYKYGMAQRSGYVATMTTEHAIQNYLSRDVTLLSGDADTVDNGNEDQSCAALLQGPNRTARSANYFAYIQALAPDARHRRIVIPGVAHDGRAMFGSPLAWPALFGTGHSHMPTDGSHTLGPRRTSRVRLVRASPGMCEPPEGMCEPPEPEINR
jgi:pimeloyl-ACP methyl ester carboxylesterase